MSKSRSDAQPTLAVTPGEPAGIGPDICIAAHKEASSLAKLIYVTDPVLIEERAALLNLPVNINSLASSPWKADAFNVSPIRLRAPVIPGELSPANAGYVIDTLEQAVKLCESETAAGMVTAPVNKAVINKGGIAFSGHTEWLAERTHTARVVMMLAGAGLKVTLATTHLPLSAVPRAINAGMLTETINIVLTDLRQKFGVDDPHLLVCGLNPHAGESGHLGREEIEIIEPVVNQLRQTGAKVTGPVPADTAFTPHALTKVDAVLAMYHDQGLPVLKHAAFSDAVNITLGLPILRTSVDHGTATDLAGKGGADHNSLLAAIRCAAEVAMSA